MRTVADIMTARPYCVNVEDPLEEAWQVMRHKHVRHVPIIKRDGTLVGLITHRNLLVNAQDISHLSLPVAEIMETDVETVTETDDLKDVAVRLYDRRVGCLPVLRGNEVVGIVTSADFLALAKRLLEELEAEG